MVDKIQGHKEFAATLRKLADAVDERGIRTVQWSTSFEIVEVPAKKVRTYRSGPRSEHIIVIDWFDLEYADPDLGEQSSWEES